MVEADQSQEGKVRENFKVTLLAGIVTREVTLAIIARHQKKPKKTQNRHIGKGRGSHRSFEKGKGVGCGGGEGGRRKGVGCGEVEGGRGWATTKEEEERRSNM